MVDRVELGKTLNLEIDFIPESNSNRPGTKIKPEYITIHNTDNTGRGADSLAHAKYMKGADAQRRKVSWHYTVDDKLCVKHLPLDEMGWHAASATGNQKSIAIEICMNAGIDQGAANKRAATLTAILLYDLSIPINNVVPHHHWSGKNCPRLLLDSGKPGEKWKKFLEEVKLIYQSIEPQEEMVRNLFSSEKESSESELLVEWFDTHGIEETVDNETPIELEDSDCEALTDSEEIEDTFEALSPINVQLPESGQGFYSYSEHRYKQYGLAKTIQAIEAIAKDWFSKHPDGPVIGVGNISLKGGGAMPPHKSHRTGLDVDFRPLRKDGSRVRVTYRDSSYSRERTQELVKTIRSNPVLEVNLIFFNDPNVNGVDYWEGHDDHLHVRFKKPEESIHESVHFSTTSRVFNACKAHVHNRGTAPDSFLNKLVDWCKQAPDEVFTQNDNYDIYSHVYQELGPWEGLLHRKAVMLEVLRVLAGFESSWKWNAGIDTTNPSSNTPCTEEAGIFQCSGNSMNFDRSLKAFLQATSGEVDCDTFRSVSKSNHVFAIEYCARLLRFTVNHHGPVKRREIHRWLKRDAVAEFKKFLSD